MNAPRCLRCQTEMNLLRTASLMLRDRDPLLPVGYVRDMDVSSIEVEVWCCPGCGHIELFRHDEAVSDDGDGDTIAQTKCPRCGRLHDLDYPKCPFCGFNENT